MTTHVTTTSLDMVFDPFLAPAGDVSSICEQCPDSNRDRQRYHLCMGDLSAVDLKSVSRGALVDRVRV